MHSLAGFVGLLLHQSIHSPTLRTVQRFLDHHSNHRRALHNSYRFSFIPSFLFRVDFEFTPQYRLFVPRSSCKQCWHSQLSAFHFISHIPCTASSSIASHPSFCDSLFLETVVRRFSILRIAWQRQSLAAVLFRRRHRAARPIDSSLHRTQHFLRSLRTQTRALLSFPTGDRHSLRLESALSDYLLLHKAFSSITTSQSSRGAAGSRVQSAFVYPHRVERSRLRQRKPNPLLSRRNGRGEEPSQSKFRRNRNDDRAFVASPRIGGRKSLHDPCLEREFPWSQRHAGSSERPNRLGNSRCGSAAVSAKATGVDTCHDRLERAHRQRLSDSWLSNQFAAGGSRVFRNGERYDAHI